MSMTTIEAALASATPIHVFGRGFMTWPKTAERSAELGLADAGMFGFWANGRAGVLGDVDATVAAAGIGFMAPAETARYWAARPAELSPWDAALAWFDCAARFGRETLAPMPEERIRRMSDLARKVIDGAGPSMGALFAGSTLIPLPGDAAGDATINLNVLREMRGGAHLSACHAAGLGPHATIMSTDDPVRGGVNWSEAFGWAAPHPDPDVNARTQVEAMTNTAMARVYESLTADERAEFVQLVTEAHALLA